MAVRQMLVADRYRLLEPVGAGGMGRVWLARDQMLDRDVAIKEIVPPDWMTDAEKDRLRDRTLREARSAARLNHPNVVRIYDVVRHDDQSWIVMEYIPSRSLHQVLQEEGPYDPAGAARIGLAVLDALDAAHRAAVLHRDVKPHNVLIGTDGRVVLTDFGLATFLDDGTITAPGLIVGSPQYVSPERARDGASTVESDLWSLGATVYAAVEGRSPYARDSAMATLAALATEPPDPPVRAGPLGPVLEGLLRYRPADRLTVAEVERRLRLIVSVDHREIPLVPGQRTTRHRVEEPPRSATAAAGVHAASAGRVHPTSGGPGGPTGGTLSETPEEPSKPTDGAMFDCPTPEAEPDAGPLEPDAGPSEPDAGPSEPLPAKDDLLAFVEPISGPGAVPEPAGVVAASSEKPPPDPAGHGEEETPAEATTAAPSPHDEVTTPLHHPGQDLVPAVSPHRTVLTGQVLSPAEERPPHGPGPAQARTRVRRTVVAGLLVVLLGGSVAAGYLVQNSGPRPHVVLPPTAVASSTPSAVPSVGTSGGPASAVPRLDSSSARSSARGALPTTVVSNSVGISPVACDAPPPPDARTTPRKDAARGVNGWNLHAGWSYFNDGSGFHIAVPDGWTYQRIGKTYCFRHPRRPVVMTLDVGRDPAVDPVRACQAENLRLQREGGPAGYTLIGITAVPLLHKAADWDYRYQGEGGSPRRAGVRWFTVDGKAYVLGWATPDHTWNDDLSKIQMIRSTFYASRPVTAGTDRSS